MGGAGITRIEAFLILEIGIFLFIRIDWPGGEGRVLLRFSAAPTNACSNASLYICFATRG